ncbi:hypothetical protein [Bacillus sp. FSL K6-3431]|uniref:hypothetical protein n=1 Tax=Bacillus sp. FSL K6-3431 TaxID=2921500 RepID=UPI0030F80E41
MKTNILKLSILFTAFLLFFGFNTTGTAKASTDVQVDTVNQVNIDEVQPYCLTCGGTVTKNYKVLSSTREYGTWKDANKPK